MKNKSLIVAVLLVLVAGGAGFFGGMKYQQGKTSSQFQAFRNGTGARTGNGTGGTRAGANAGTGFRPVTGSVLSVDASSMTVKLQDGSSRIVLISGTTQISKADQATSGDIKVGDTVSAFGQTNSDGSITAQNIQLNPIVRNPSGSPMPSPAQ